VSEQPFDTPDIDIDTDIDIDWSDVPQLPLLHVEPNQIIGFNDRARRHYPDMEELAESIREKGVIQPLAVQATDEEGIYLLLAGGRRYLAACMAHLRPLPVIVFPATLSDLEAKEIQLFENVQRLDFTWSEKDKLTKEIHELKIAQHGAALAGGVGKTGHSLNDTAELMGKERSSVSKSIARAEALERYPQLKDAKNASEADRILKKIERQEVARVAAERFEEDVINTTDAESRKRVLVNGYIKGDFFDAVQDVPDHAAHIIEIDPPYGIELDHIKRVSSESTDGYTETDAYEKFITATMQECSRVLAPGGWVICWHAFQWSAATFNAMQDIGLTVNPIPGFWIKVTGQTNQPERRLASTVEPFYYGTISGHIIKQGRNNSFHYKSAPPTEKIHPTERPIEMMQEIISTFVHPGAFLFCPFLGSGNTLLAGSNVGMGNAFGFDLDEEDIYRNGFIKRVEDGTHGEYKSYKPIM
jgi:ParB/RepB/Spo0J family partition protein